MNVLFYYDGFVDPRDQLAGTSTMMWRMAQCFSKDNFVMCASKRIGESFIVEGIAIADATSFRDINNLIDPFDVVFFYCDFDMSVIKKPPHQIWVRSIHCWAPNLKSFEFLKNCEVITAVSQIHKEYLKTFSVDAHVVDNCIDHSVFKWDGKNRRSGICYAGSVSNYKKVDIAIDCAIKYGYELHIYGDSLCINSDPYYENKVIKSASMNTDKIFFHGFVKKEELAEAFNKHLILVLPSGVESFGLVTVECQACGCIPVVHNVAGTPATLIDGETGILYHPNDIDNLHQAIQLAFDLPDDSREKAMQFSNKFNIENSYQQMCDHLAPLL